MCPHESCCPFTSPRKTNTHSGVSKRVQERRKWLYARFALHYLLDNHEIFLWRSPLTEPSSQLSDRLSSSFPSDSVRSRAMLSFGHTWLISSSVNTTSQLESHRTNQRDKGNLSASCGPHETSHLTWAGRPACYSGNGFLADLSEILPVGCRVTITVAEAVTTRVASDWRFLFTLLLNALSVFVRDKMIHHETKWNYSVNRTLLKRTPVLAKHPCARFDAQTLEESQPAELCIHFLSQIFFGCCCGLTIQEIYLSGFVKYGVPTFTILHHCGAFKFSSFERDDEQSESSFYTPFISCYCRL